MADEESEFLECPYLGTAVELTAERRAHIEVAHGEVLPAFFAEFAETLRDPDRVMVRPPNERAFVRLWPNVAGGKHLFVVVLTDRLPSNGDRDVRHWVVTAYAVRRFPGWSIEWHRV